MTLLRTTKRFVAIALAAGAAAGASLHAHGAQAPRESFGTLAQGTHVVLPSPDAVAARVQPEANSGMPAQGSNLVSAGLTITPTFDTTITNDPNAAAIENTINSAIAIVESQFADPINVTINFKEMPGGLGRSSWWYLNGPYASFLAALKADARTADDATAMSLLPSVATNPVNGQTTINVHVANLRAVGFVTPPTPDGFDGTISLNTTITSPGSSGSSLVYSLQAVALHEIDEVLGLGSSLPSVLQGTIFPEDLYRYSAANTRSFTATDSRTSGVFAYFSIDAATLLAEFDNQNDGGDFGDWQSNPRRPAVSPKVQDAFATPGSNPLPSVEFTALDVMGYDRVVANAPPMVTSNPANLAVTPGQQATFTAFAAGSPEPTIQWQVSLDGTTWTNIAGATANPYVFIAALSDNGKLFRAVFTNGSGSVASAGALLTVSTTTMALDRSVLVFTAIDSGAAFTAVTVGQAVRMTQAGNGTVTWTASSNQPWLVVSPTSGTGSVTFNVSTQFVGGLAAAQVGSITINLTGAGNAVRPITVELNAISLASARPPFGSFDTPTNGAAGVAGSIAVTGWSLDFVQVMRVTVCRDPVAGEPAPINGNCANTAQIYIGDAVFIDGARTDVQADFPSYPLNSRAGWGYLLLTNFLPGLGNGTFNLRAYAYDAEGLTTALGVKTITCDNLDSKAPFGAIDVPAQGAITSGLVGNTGWVLAQTPNFADPPDGGTVNVFVDGNNVGAPSLWNARPDLTALFPSAQYPGVSQALGIFGLDTTTLTNGVHTIFWLATGAPGGGTQGIGSRFFTVSNGAQLLTPAAATSSPGAVSHAATVIASRSTLDLPAAAAARIVSGERLASEIAAAPLDRSTVQGRRGFDLDLPLRTYTPSSGAVDVQAEELDRVELHLGTAGHQQYTGYLQTAGGLKPLPVGSSLDASTGTFTWMPGVGFYGTYHLTFVRWSAGTAVARQDVRITLNAKGSNRIGPQTIIDAPKTGASVGSPFFVGGWAADLDSTVDTGVNTVHVWAYPVDARGNRLDPIFIGPAIYGGARPDVAAVYGDRFDNSGYGIIVNGLAPGTYDIAVFAYSTVVNTFTPATVVRVTVR